MNRFDRAFLWMLAAIAAPIALLTSVLLLALILFALTAGDSESYEDVSYADPITFTLIGVASSWYVVDLTSMMRKR